MRNIKRKKINFVGFFDENLVDNFQMLFSSVEKVYNENDFSFYIGLNSKAFELISKKFEKEIDEGYINIVNVDDSVDLPESNGLFGTITKLTYGRLFISELFPIFKKDNFIYLDIDILLNKKIPKNFLDSKYNIACNASNPKFKFFGNNNKFFWRNHFDRMYSKTNDINYIKVKKNILKKISLGNYFNAGVIIVNDPIKYNSLCEKIRNDKLSLMKILDDQSLLNYYNKNEIKVTNNNSINFKVLKDKNFKNNISVFHFLGSTKNIMKNIYEENFDFSILNTNFPNLLHTTLIRIFDNEENLNLYKSSNVYKKAKQIKEIYVVKETKIDEFKSLIKSKYILIDNKNSRLNHKNLNKCKISDKDNFISISKSFDNETFENLKNGIMNNEKNLLNCILIPTNEFLKIEKINENSLLNLVNKANKKNKLLRRKVDLKNEIWKK